MLEPTILEKEPLDAIAIVYRFCYEAEVRAAATPLVPTIETSRFTALNAHMQPWRLRTMLPGSNRKKAMTSSNGGRTLVCALSKHTHTS